MKSLIIFIKSFKEQLRSFWDLILILILAPGFVILYWAFFGGGSTNYNVLVINQDEGHCLALQSQISCADLLIEDMKAISYKSGEPILNINLLEDQTEAEHFLQENEAVALIFFPADFSSAVNKAQSDQKPAETAILISGNLTNPYYSIAAIFASTAMDGFIGTATQRENLIEIREIPLGESDARSEFEIYVPGLLIVAITMMVFSVAMSIASEIENGTIRRLLLTHMSAFHYFSGVTLLYILIGLASVALTFITAVLLGFSSNGSLWLAGLISLFTCLAVIGAGLITSCFSKTAASASILSMFPMLLMMFFSGAVFPMPNLKLFTIGTQQIGLFDFIPTTHAVLALNKILTLGCGIEDVGYEFSMLVFLSLIYFLTGVALFQKLHLKRSS